MRHLVYVTQVNLQHTVTHTHRDIFTLKILQLPRKRQLVTAVTTNKIVGNCLVCGNCNIFRAKMFAYVCHYAEG